MALWKTYSRRRRQAEKTGTDVYQYVDMSPKLRRQVVYVFEDITKEWIGHYWNTLEFWSEVVDVMRRELGVSELIRAYSSDHYSEFYSWFMADQEIDHLIDAIEVLVAFTAYHENEGTYGFNQGRHQRHIDELNARFLEEGLGFQIEDGLAIQISSKFIHAEVVIPTLSLLANPKFATANEEFRKAHAEFRAGSYEDCLTDCCKAFESVLKIISAELGWGSPKNATAKSLIQAAYDNKLIPDYMQNEFTGLRSILEGGVPAVRNKASGHGQGASPRTVDANLASFQLHQTAAAILFLVKQAER